MSQLVASSVLNGDYTAEVGHILATVLPRTFVDVGMRRGELLRSLIEYHPDCSYIGIDLFRQMSPVPQLEEAQSILGNLPIHIFRGSADYFARAYPPRHLDVVHINVGKDAQLIRFMVSAWKPKTKRLIVPNEREYVDVLGVPDHPGNCVGEYRFD